jgi:anti-sigma B factor antagonist
MSGSTPSTLSAVFAPRAEVLRLTGELTIFRADELKQLLTSEPAALAIDLSGVTEIDTAGVQLLLLSQQTAPAGQAAPRLVAHSPAVLDVFKLLNLGVHFAELAPPAMPTVATGQAHES